MQASASVTASGDSKAAIGEALKQALSGNRLQSISLHDERGDVLWLDEGALGPDEHNLVIDAAAALAAGPDKSYVFQNVGDGRAAAFLPARSPLNDLVGIAMIIADAKFLDSRGAAKFVTPTTTNLMRRLAFMRKPPPPAAPAPPATPPPANRVASPPPPQRPAAPPIAGRPAAPSAAQRPAAPPARPATPPVAQRPAAPPPAPRAPAAAAKPPAAAPKAAAPPQRAAAAPPARPPVAAKAGGPGASSHRSTADSDSIAFEISDIDPKSLLKGSRPAPQEAKRPDLRVVQTDRLPKLKIDTDPIPDLIQDDEPYIGELSETDGAADIASDEVTTEVEALADPETNMNVEPEYVDEAPPLGPGPGQFEFYGQIFELHVQELIKLKGSGGTRRFEVLVRDAQADNEFGVAPDRVLQDVHDPSANSDLDRIVVERLVLWLNENRNFWENTPASFSVNVGMGTIADPKFASYVATTLKNQKIPAKVIGFEIAEKSCVEQVRDVDMFVQACEKIGCHVVLDDFTLHHNSTRWLGSGAVKFVKLDPKITAVAMKERVPQALVVAITQASKVLGLSCVAKRVDTPAVRDWLSAVGIDYAQGFLLDQPRPLISIVAEPAKK